MKKFKLTAPRLVVLTSVFLAVFHNHAFFRNVAAIYPLTWGKLPFLCSLFLVLVVYISLMLMVVSSKYTIKPALMLVLAVSSLASYFMNTFNILIDEGMIRNTVQTNYAESMDLMNFKLISSFLLLGVLPSIFIYKAKIHRGSLKTELLSRLKWIAVLLAMVLVSGIGFSRYYFSFFREHKTLRYYANPVAWISSTAVFADSTFKTRTATVRPIGTDAAIPSADTDRELIILVVPKRMSSISPIFIHAAHRRRSPYLACSPFSEERVTARKRAERPKTCSMC
jgi:lipid A ethanolaminephosphotransferase